MLYRLKIEGCLAETIGSGGLLAKHYMPLLGEARTALQDIDDTINAGAWPAFSAARYTDDLKLLDDIAAAIRDSCDDVLVLATGGSKVGGEALAALAPESMPRLHFLNSLDPHTLELKLASLEPVRTCILVISKSGRTDEVLAQLLICLDWVRSALDEVLIRNHVLAITDPGSNPLRAIAAHIGFPVYDHDPDVGGRYSVLTLVGLLPALIIGLDGAAVRSGAAEVLSSALVPSKGTENAPACGSAVTVAFLRHQRIAMNVLMNYSNRLTPFSSWHRQLWAESLGKQGRGLTPIHSLGSADQHSQLQLYLDGPVDKLFTLILCDEIEQGPSIDSHFGLPEESTHLLGRSLGDMLLANQRAMTEVLIANCRPTRLIEISRFNEETLGALFMHFLLETVLVARLLGVNPFDQPAVEKNKKLARHYLTQMGE